MKNLHFVFMFLLVCSLALPSINFVYAEPIADLIELGETVNATEDQTLDNGIIINEGGELIVDSGVTLKINGVVVNSGKITIDGDLIVDGLIINNSKIIVRCGVIDVDAALVLGNNIEFVSCETGSNEILLDDFTIVSGEKLSVPENKILINSGTLIIEGTLENLGSIENKGGILFNGGTIKNIGTIHSLCENFEVRGIIGEGKILGSGEFTGTTCSAPESENDAYSVDEDKILTVGAAEGVLANDSDADTDSTDLTAEITMVPTSGTIALNPDGSFTYTPNTDYFGADSFEYKLSDGENEVTATVAIDVLPVNDAPTAVNDAYTTDEDTSLAVSSPGVLINDFDVDSTDLTVEVIVDSTYGTTILESDGVFTYTPNENFFGADSFTYSVTDNDGETNTATVAITVTDVNDLPIANDDSATTLEDVAILVDVTENDTDVDGTIDSAAVSITSSPTSGTA